MAELAVILGSGFSKPGGLPLAKEINNYFIRDNTENILAFSSGEYKWIDFANEKEKKNGKGGYDHYAMGILLNEFVNLFIANYRVFTNYEDFFQYVLDNLTCEEKIENLRQKSFSEFDEHFPKIKEGQFYKMYTNAIKNYQWRHFKSMMNHLVGDLLYIRIPEEEFKVIYETFVEFIQDYKSIDFITLNHDLLLENIITEIQNNNYCDGFTTNQKILKSRRGKPLNIFQGKFCDEINIIKLHGSIDLYRIAIGEEEGTILNLTGDYLYFKTNSFEEKQSPIRHDPDTDEIVQKFNPDIDPQFITGTKKENIISQSELYKTLFQESEDRIMKCNTLLIIGYSFGDEHVNQLIKVALEESEVLKTIINVNPSLSLPFSSEEVVIKEYSSIDELTELSKEEHQL